MLPTILSIVGIKPLPLPLDILKQRIGRLRSLLHILLIRRQQLSAALDFPLEITAGLLNMSDERVPLGTSLEFEIAAHPCTTPS
ncbi:hypothetical protein [Rhizobium sp. CF122]|uniref:hypothetical protein n=1 Tax=Rhizobium sp. CF122 TaxID=1144312 RepID=UPI0003014BD3|nr:hypothetical protein [Rhizobium sp. CF122]